MTVVALADRVISPDEATLRAPWRVVLVDPGLMTAPYDAALSAGLMANRVTPIWATRALRVGEEDLVRGAIQLFYPWTDGPRRRFGRLWRMAKGVEHLLGLQALDRFVTAERPDIVHVQWSMLPRFDRAAVRRLRRICPVVMTLHDVQPFNGKAVHQLQRAGFRQLWSAADHLIVHTGSGRDAVVAAGIPPDRVSVVPHGVLGVRRERRHRTSSRRWRIVQFGRIQSYKGVDVLVEALGLLEPAARDRLTVTVAGEAQIDMMPIRQRAVDLGLEGTLHFQLGHCSRAAMDALLDDADAFVFPYRVIEASGMLYEVAPLGRWIIASRLGSFAELLGSDLGAAFGTLVPPGDPAALAAALTASVGQEPADDLSRLVPDWAAIGARTRAVYTAARSSWRADGHRYQ